MIRCVAFDFDGVLTDNAVYVLQDGTEMVRCTRADGLGLQQLQAKGLAIVVISTEKNPIVSARCAKLGVECVQDSADKVRSLEGFLKHLGISLEETAFLGNDVNDSAVLKAVGFPAVVADAHPDVVSLARHRTSRPGGHGAVREFSEFLLSSGLVQTNAPNESALFSQG